MLLYQLPWRKESRATALIRFLLRLALALCLVGIPTGLVLDMPFLWGFSLGGTVLVTTILVRLRRWDRPRRAVYWSPA